MEEQVLRGTRVAFFGGSFDPPHLGHLAIAQAAQASLALDTVLFAPVGYQPLKPKGSTAGFEDRMAMTELAIAGEPGFEISAIDAPKADGRPNYTVDTLARLKSQMTADCALYFLMGADSFLNLKKWHRAAEIPFLAPLIVAFRPGESMDDLKAALPLGLSVETPPARARAGEPSVPASMVEVLAAQKRDRADDAVFSAAGAARGRERFADPGERARIDERRWWRSRGALSRLRKASACRFGACVYPRTRALPLVHAEEPLLAGRASKGYD